LLAVSPHSNGYCLMHRLDKHTNRQRELLCRRLILQSLPMPCLYTNNDGIYLVIAVFFDVRSLNRAIVFVTHYTHVMHVQYRCWYRSIFSYTDTELILVVSADTEYPMPTVYNSNYFFHSSDQCYHQYSLHLTERCGQDDFVGYISRCFACP